MLRSLHHVQKVVCNIKMMTIQGVNCPYSEVVGPVAFNILIACTSCTMLHVSRHQHEGYLCVDVCLYV